MFSIYMKIILSFPSGLSLKKSVTSDSFHQLDNCLALFSDESVIDNRYLVTIQMEFSPGYPDYAMKF